MSEVMNQTIYDLGEILLEANAEPGKIQDAIKEILLIKTLAVIDRRAGLPNIFTNEEELKSILRYREELTSYVLEIK